MTDEERAQKDEERREKNRIKYQRYMEKKRAQRSEQQAMASASSAESTAPSNPGSNPSTPQITNLSPGFVQPLSVQVNVLSLQSWNLQSSLIVVWYLKMLWCLLTLVYSIWCHKLNFFRK